MVDHVKFFRQTSPYINMHRGKTFVIAISGDGVMHGNFPHVIQDIALLHSLGIRIVLVHGTRPQIEQRLAEHDANAGGLAPPPRDRVRRAQWRRRRLGDAAHP